MEMFESGLAQLLEANKMWKQRVNSESNEVRMSVQIRELCEWRG